jgi:hypothetical protein
MSEIPALRDALVAAAARRAHRHRRLAIRATAWTAATAAAAAVLALAITQHAPDRERAATPARPTSPLARAFPVFARPARPEDEPPAWPAEIRAAGAAGGDGATPGEGARGDGAAPGEGAGGDGAAAGEGAGGDGATGAISRRIVDRDGVQAWVIAGGTGAGAKLCTVLAFDGTTSGGCGTVGVAARRGTGIWLGTTALQVAPAGSGDVRVRFGDGHDAAPRVIDGAALVRGTRQITAVGFTAPDGTRFVHRYGSGTAIDLDRRCARLGALPNDAIDAASRAALLAVDDVYPAVTEATIGGVKPLAGDLCPNTLVVELRLTQPDSRTGDSLAQGRLLLGLIDGRMTVWRLQH